MDRKLIYLNLMAIITLIIVLFFNKDVTPTIKYFPIDPEITFNYANTSLRASIEDSSYSLNWKSASETNEPVYLRQDVSLLYSNGKLIGLKSKWKENTDSIHINEWIKQKDNRFYQAISFHHGENHYNEVGINSVQQMTYDQLYVIKENKSFSHHKHTPNNEGSKLENKIKQDLIAHWNGLINHFHLNVKEYHILPLTSLGQAYIKDTLPLPRGKRKQILGQLWEGLYKNYILPSIEMDSKELIPILLLAKDESHLKVLFQLNNKKKKLIQQYPTN